MLGPSLNGLPCRGPSLNGLPCRGPSLNGLPCRGPSLASTRNRSCYPHGMAQSAVVGAPSFEPAYGRPMSLEEWEQMAEDEPGELVDGLLQEEEVADSPHEVIVSALLY